MEQLFVGLDVSKDGNLRSNVNRDGQVGVQEADRPRHYISCLDV